MASNNSQTLFECKSNSDLAKWLNIELKQLTYLAYRQPENRYISFKIPKRKPNEYRIIEAPRADLKHIQRSIADELRNLYRGPICTYGFVPNRNIALGAKNHVKKRTVMTIDLENFFHSISSSRVRGIFINVCHCTPEVANTLTNLTCLNGKLPQGAPSSPIISNLVCYSMDRALVNYSISHRISYSRYADDLTFSSTSPYLSRHFCNQGAEGIEAVNRDIREIIESRNSFKINPHKIHIRGNGSRQTVTGIVVNTKCNFTRETYRGFRVLFHNIKCMSIDGAAREYVQSNPQYQEKLFKDCRLISEELFITHIKGRLTYLTMITSVNRKPSSPLIKLWTMFYELTKQTVPMISLDYYVFKTISESNFRKSKGEEDSYCVDGTAFYLNGYFITCRHCVTGAEHQADVITNGLAIHTDHPASKNKSISYLDDEISCQFDYDVAWCKAPNSYTPACRMILNPVDLPQVGEEVIAVGYEGGSYSPSIISSKVSYIRQDKTEIGVDRAFIHGMSGGAIFNQQHELIGILRKGSDSEAYYHNGAFIPIANLIEREPFKITVQQTISTEMSD